jgi:ATP-dependent DNA helicase RecQ
MDETAKTLLRQYWGHADFRGSQEAIIEAALGGRDVMALLPTGGGKSLCYQIPGILQPGLCVVVSPLLALMEDQVSDLNARGIRAMSLSGKLRQEDLIRKLDNVEHGRYRFLYLSPERLQQELVLERIKNLNINLIAIDEAHCISQWGFDFRPAYLNCTVLRDLLPAVPMMTLTATATPEVMKDIEERLRLGNPVIFRDSIERLNITYSVLETEDKNYRLLQLLKHHPGSAIAYVQTRRATVLLAKYLKDHGIASAAFHGGMSAEDKQSRLREWQRGSLRVMTATNAFGMGIDKADVRLVVHFEVPETLEHYFQEAGRAGRDGKPALAALLLGPDDIGQARDRYLGNLPSVKEVLRTYEKLNSYFGIAYGERNEESLPFDFADFCATYNLPTALTYNALEILDRQGVLTLSQQFWQKSRIQFICSKPVLWGYLKRYPKLQSTVQTLLRTYGGLFDFETPVNLRAISGKLQIPESLLIKQLGQLHKDEIIRMESSKGDLQLRFLLPREDEKTIYAFAKHLEARLQVKRKKVGMMADYLKNTALCRQVQLLAYFGETRARPCGSCDVCLGSPVMDPYQQEALKRTILKALEEGPKSSRELLESVDLPEGPALLCLRNLLQEGRLSLGAENQYVLS